ncbi:hypothetical protein RHMOL_Rhmol02G0213200 [Rhododendron molle]|uniref:Uncharacterized protein n=1 Tax=Rhododendron molle TaxID=49168 RepID=A0ACC0PVM5_RHOML|nr:hypothetical protein RHMOL_Rhmol02G0213200 [Rhododendron molle]
MRFHKKPTGGGANKISSQKKYSKIGERTVKRYHKRGLRFKDRLLTRSDETSEVLELEKQSENKMKRCLNWWDLTWVGFGAVIGAGIFVLTGQEAHFDAGPAIVISYLASGFSTMLSVFIYTEFDVEIPVAGGSFAYLRVELGDFAAFMAAANILLDYMLGNAAVARSWTSYLTTLLNRPSNSLVIHTNLKQGYNLLDPIAVIVLAIASAIAIASTQKTSLINWIASAVNMVVIFFVTIAGSIRYAYRLSRAKTGTPISATLMMTTGSAVISFFTSLDVLAGLLAVSGCFLSTLLPVALRVRRYYVTGITPRANALKFVALLLLILLASAATSAYWALTSTGWIGYTITLPLWFLGTLGMSVLLPLQRTPKVWGVPLVPWFPSLAVVTNLFLMGSLDASAFVRFSICTIVIMVYYFFFGLHATYDMAHEPNKPESMKIADIDSETPFQVQNLEI